MDVGSSTGARTTNSGHSPAFPKLFSPHQLSTVAQFGMGACEPFHYPCRGFDLLDLIEVLCRQPQLLWILECSSNALSWRLHLAASFPSTSSCILLPRLSPLLPLVLTGVSSSSPLEAQGSIRKRRQKNPKSWRWWKILCPRHNGTDTHMYPQRLRQGAQGLPAQVQATGNPSMEKRKWAQSPTPVRKLFVTICNWQLLREGKSVFANGESLGRALLLSSSSWSTQSQSMVFVCLFLCCCFSFVLVFFVL